MGFSIAMLKSWRFWISAGSIITTLLGGYLYHKNEKANAYDNGYKDAVAQRNAEIVKLDNKQRKRDSEIENEIYILPDSDVYERLESKWMRKGQ